MKYMKHLLLVILTVKKKPNIMTHTFNFYSLNLFRAVQINVLSIVLLF